MTKTVLITGASSGFGALTAKKFSEEGWNVVATMRSPDRDQSLGKLDGVKVIELDVTKPETIERALKTTLDTFGQLDVLVNNAGHGGHGVFEAFTDAEIRAMFETNFFGALAVSRAALPLLRKQGHGVIINVTSIAGMISGPTSGIYAATKFALEAVTESMATEYAPLGIRVRSVAPGAFTTGFRGANRDGTAQVDDQLAAYAGELYKELDVRIDAMYEGAPHASMVADKIFHVATTADTPYRNPVGPDAEAVDAALHAMPRQAFLDQMGQPRD